MISGSSFKIHYAVIIQGLYTYENQRFDTKKQINTFNIYYQSIPITYVKITPVCKIFRFKI